MCLSPVTLWRQYATKDGRKTDIVPCGKCVQCLAKRRNDWAFRLYHQMMHSDTACFMTLTYGQQKERGVYQWGENPPLSFNGNETLDKRHLQLFFKRLRKENSRLLKDNDGILSKNQKKLKYYAVGEYGTNFLRPHYHIIMFNLHSHLISRSFRVAKNIWQKGSVDIAVCNIATINYVVGYLMQGSWTPLDDSDDRQPHYSTMSKGLGSQYLSDTVYNYHLDRMEIMVTHPSGFQMTMPRYYKKQVFSKEELKEFEEIRQQLFNVDWDDFVNIDRKLNLERDKRAIKKHEMNLKTNRVTL